MVHKGQVLTKLDQSTFAERENIDPTAALRFKPDAAVLAHYAGPSPPATPGVGKGVWVLNGTMIAPVPVTSGLADGTYTELVNSPLGEGAAVVTRATAPVSGAPPPAGATGNPLLPSRPGLGRRG
jgi:hypothetical protein